MNAERFEFKVRHKNDYEVVVSVSADANITEVMEAFEAFLQAAGFDPSLVRETLRPE